MSKTTDVAVQPESQLPALASTPALEISADNIALPRLYRGERQADIVQSGLAPAGSIYVAAGANDPSPEVVVKDATSDKEEGVLVHILGLTTNLSAEVDGELQRWDTGDPSAPEHARVGFNYIVALPEVDPDVPVKLLMNKSSEATGKRINFHLLKNKPNQAWNLAFRLKLKERTRSNGGQTNRWYVWTEKQVDATPANIEIAERLSVFAAAAPKQADIEKTAGPGNEPGI